MVLLRNFSRLATTQLNILYLVLLFIARNSLGFFVINICMWHAFVFWKLDERQIYIKWNVWVLLIIALHWYRWICLSTWKEIVFLSTMEA